MDYDFDKPVDRSGTDSMKWSVGSGELPMWVADMDFETAPCIAEAVKKRASRGVFGYTLVPDEWYDSIAGWWKRRHGWDIKKESLIFCTGVVPAISCLVKRFSCVGDKILTLTPVYDIFFHSIENAGRTVCECPLDYRDGEYSINFSDLEAKLSDPLTTMMILCNPHNPIGKIWSREQLAGIGALCKKHGVIVISDEIHCDLTAPGKKYVPFASVSEDCADNSVICLSASKAFNIAGLQSAAVVVCNESMRNRAERGLNSDELAEPNCFAAIATAAAFGDEGERWLDSLREYLNANKRFASDYIRKEIPLVRTVEQDATYLMWLDCSAFCDDAEITAEFIRERTGLYLSSGNRYRGNGNVFLRMNVACRRELLKSGLEKLRKGVVSFVKEKTDKKSF